MQWSVSVKSLKIVRYLQAGFTSFFLLKMMECLKHSWWNVWNFQKLRYHFEWQSWYAFLLAVGRKFSLRKKFRRRHLKGVIIKLEKRLKLSFVWRKIFLSYLDYFLKLLRMPFNLLTTNVSHHIETSQLICIANQLTGFYMMGNIGCQWVEKKII